MTEKQSKTLSFRADEMVLKRLDKVRAEMERLVPGVEYSMASVIQFAILNYVRFDEEE